MHRRLASAALTLALIFSLLACTPRLVAQHNAEDVLSEGEIEQLRDSAYVANDRVLVFLKILDTRTKQLQDLYAKPRRPGREQDTHDLLEQFTAIADELDDNLDDYSSHHRDIRKSLPKLLEATERWATIIKTPPDNETYKVSRNLALEAIRDLRESATELVNEQKTWFAAHPPSKERPGEDTPAPR
jgi:hypothetical protein